MKKFLVTSLICAITASLLTTPYTVKATELTSFKEQRSTSELKKII